VNGGRLVAEGHIKDIVRCQESLTGQLLREPLQHPLHALRDGETKFVEIIGARCTNLKNL